MGFGSKGERMDFQDYYRVLGVSKTATAEEIRSSFRKKAREFHPDVAKDKVKGGGEV